MRWWVFIKLGRPRRAAAAPAIPAAASVGRRGLLLACLLVLSPAGPRRADWPLARAGSAKQFWRRQIG